jgi:outer membrane protein TolC
MSEVPTGPAPQPSGQEAINRRAWSRERQMRAAEAAQKSLDVVHHQLELGSVNYLALVGAEQTYQQAMVGLVQARANRYADTAALFQALGGSISPPAAHT